MPDAPMDFNQFLTYMVENDSAAAEVVRVMLKFSGPRSINALNILDDMGIRGILLWYCFDDICNRDVELFFGKIEKRTIATDLATIPYAKYEAPR